jgi:hypothetical protein
MGERGVDLRQTVDHERRQRTGRDVFWVSHSFVSLLSAHDVIIEHISWLVGHTNTVVTETVYRQQIRPTIQEGATAMNILFPKESRRP